LGIQSSFVYAIDDGHIAIIGSLAIIEPPKPPQNAKNAPILHFLKVLYQNIWLFILFYISLPLQLDARASVSCGSA
jgi:hypothetical protein